jgi:hypothetical protein
MTRRRPLVSAAAPAGDQPGPLVTVILPTHSHASAVELAAQSVLRQSVRSLELPIGDGATPEARAAVAPLLAGERVRFMGRPKSPSRAELAVTRYRREPRHPMFAGWGRR